MVLRLLAVFLVFGLCIAAVRTTVEMRGPAASQEAAVKPARELASAPAGLSFAATRGRLAQ